MFCHTLDPSASTVSKVVAGCVPISAEQGPLGTPGAGAFVCNRLVCKNSFGNLLLLFGTVVSACSYSLLIPNAFYHNPAGSVATARLPAGTPV